MLLCEIYIQLFKIEIFIKEEEFNMSKYVGGNSIENMKCPNFMEYLEEEYEKKERTFEQDMKKWEESEDKDQKKRPEEPNIDFPKYGGMVWKFLNDMQTVPAKTLEKIPGHYDKFLKNVKAILTTGGTKPSEKCVVAFLNIDDSIMSRLKKEFDWYCENGKNKERVDKVKNVYENICSCSRYSTAPSLCSQGIKDVKLREGGRKPDSKKRCLTGKVWKDTLTDIFHCDKNMEVVTLAEGVKFVEPLTFVNCMEIKSLHVDANVKIKKMAFVNCPNLEKIIIRNGIKDVDIEQGAFINCNKELSIKGKKDKRIGKDTTLEKIAKYDDLKLNEFVGKIQKENIKNIDNSFIEAFDKKYNEKEAKEKKEERSEERATVRAKKRMQEELVERVQKKAEEKAKVAEDSVAPE